MPLSPEHSEGFFGFSGPGIRQLVVDLTNHFPSSHAPGLLSINDELQQAAQPPLTIWLSPTTSVTRGLLDGSHGSERSTRTTTVG